MANGGPNFEHFWLVVWTQVTNKQPLDHWHQDIERLISTFAPIGMLDLSWTNALTPCVKWGLYTRSHGQCSNQTQHSYWCKSWNLALKSFTQPMSQDRNRKNKFNLPQVLINAKDTIKFGATLDKFRATLDKWEN